MFLGWLITEYCHYIFNINIGDESELNYGDFETRTAMVTTVLGHQAGELRTSL
jgi:hypothetical protein